MSGSTNTPTEARLERLGRLIQLQFEARHAATLEELHFHMVNNSHHVVPYRQAAVWSAERHKRGRVAAVSGTPQIDSDAPYIVWLRKVLTHLASSESQDVRPVGPEDIPPDLRADWANWLPARAVWIPMIGSKGGALGGLFLSRDEPWSEDDEYLLAQLVDSFAVAWVSFIARRPWTARIARSVFDRKLLWVILALIVAAVFIPVPQSVLAPAEVVAEEPALARARLKGVVNRIHVRPNDTVRKGQLLFDLDDTDLRNQLRLAELKLEVARAEFRQVSQKALFDTKSKTRVQVLKGKVDVETARLKRLQDQLKLVDARASRDGIAVFSDANDWIGRPVAAGEKIMEIADPVSVILEAALPVSDAIALEPDARVVFFPNIDPENTLPAQVLSVGFRARATPEGVLAYRLKAAFEAGVERPRIGLRGTAKIYGGQNSLFYFLFRRPLSKARQWLGL